MNSKLIFVPVMVLVFWTFIIMLFMACKRFSAGLAGRLKPGAFRVGESPEKVPQDVRLANRNSVNLFEMPVLFLRCALRSTRRAMYRKRCWCQPGYTCCRGLCIP